MRWSVGPEVDVFEVDDDRDVQEAIRARLDATRHQRIVRSMQVVPGTRSVDARIVARTFRVFVVWDNRT